MGLFDQFRSGSYEQIAHLLRTVPDQAEIVFYAQIQLDDLVDDKLQEIYQESGLIYLTSTTINLQPLDNPTIHLAFKELKVSNGSEEMTLYYAQQRYKLTHIKSLTKLAPRSVFLPPTAQAARALQQPEVEYIWDLLLIRGAQQYIDE